MKVKDIMYKQLYFISPFAKARDAARMMAERKVGSLLVKDGNDITGIVTQGDIIERVLAKGHASDTIEIDSIKNFPLIMVDSNADVLEAVELLTKYKIRRLVIVERGNPVGIISTKIIGAHLKELLRGK